MFSSWEAWNFNGKAIKSDDKEHFSKNRIRFFVERSVGVNSSLGCQ